MPVQKFAPMTKNFATFDCDAHVTEPPWLWERAKDWLTKDELEALKNTIWFDPESEQLIVNGKAGSGHRFAANRWHAGHGQRAFPGRTRPQARHPARAERAQSQARDRADRRTGRLSRSSGLLRAQAAPARHGRPGDRSGDDHPDRHRHLSVAAERGRRQGDVQGVQRLGVRILPGEPGAAVLRRAAADAESQVRRAGGLPRRGQGLPRRAGSSDRRDGQLSDSAQVRPRVARDGRDRRGLRDASVPGLRVAEAARLHRAAFRRGTDRA